MRLRTLGLAAAISAGMFQHSDAVVGQKGAEAPLVAATKAPRTHRATSFQRLGASLAGWTAIMDDDTQVPLRLMGKGAATPGAVADAAIAEVAARQFLAAHLATLAPGSSITDFVVVGNGLSRNGDVRSVGFQQYANGVRVVGGSIGVSFKRDRIAVVTSTALPHVNVAPPVHRIAPAIAAQRATEWLASAGHATRVMAQAAAAGGERVILPVVRPRTGATPQITYQVAEQLALESAKGVGRWTVWVDANDARPIARKTQIHYATGKVKYDVADRRPGGTRQQRGAGFSSHTVNGAASTSTADGTVTWNTQTAATVKLGLVGPFVAIANEAGALLADTGSLPVGGNLVFTKATDELGDAQLNAFIHANVVKQFAKSRLDPNLAWLDRTLSVVVNEADTCNAYSTGDDIHFFRRDNQCENTARLADVVYHEFGHSLHANAIIEGVGQFDGAMSEGMSDMLSALITNDPGMGRGFLHTEAPLRDLDPDGRELRWPDDATGEVHDDGEIIGGTMWDLKVALETKLGRAAGYEKILDIWYGVLQRASDMPSSYAEALLADDDDGDLTNGTPNQCEINNVFGIHGLADPSVSLGIGMPTRDNYDISIVTTPGGNTACPGPTVASGAIEWKPRGGGVGGSIVMTATGDTLAGSIPAQPDGTVVQYQVKLTLSDGSAISYPNNNADPFYEMYVGEVTTLWCADFEAGAAGWTLGATPSNRNEWEAGMPAGVGGDPKAAVSGTNILGIDLTEDGIYNNSTTSWAETPDIDLQGHTKVRLQYQRWLGVEDGFYDDAAIYANRTQVWSNYASASDPQTAGVNHADKEWRFQDVDLSAHATTGTMKLRFELKSDEGLELAGWNMDDVCVVALAGPALTCGNGAVDDGETCDDGNRLDGDGCDANCALPDGVDGEEEGGGCCSAGGSPVAPLAVSLLTFGLVIRRRRRV